MGVGIFGKTYIINETTQLDFEGENLKDLPDNATK